MMLKKKTKPSNHKGNIILVILGISFVTLSIMSLISTSTLTSTPSNIFDDVPLNLIVRDQKQEQYQQQYQQQTKTSTKTLDTDFGLTENRYPHDNPKHPWHWSREVGPNPNQSKLIDCNNKSYKELYDHFHEYGYVIFTSCTLNKDPTTTLNPVTEFTKNLTPATSNTKNKRKGKANRTDDHQQMVKTDAKNKAVMDMSLDEDIVKFIEYVHGGRRAFPFQTLNFIKGSQRAIHSDLTAHDTLPRTLMTAAWTALEDMNENNGPLVFYPKSHHYGTWDVDEVGLRFIVSQEELTKIAKLQGQEQVVKADELSTLYGEKLEKMLSSLGLESKTAHDMKKGQTMIWAASFIHGGTEQKDMSLSRLSQVTHYFFEGARSYWYPRLSNPSRLQYSFREGIIPCTPNVMIPSELFSCANLLINEWKQKFPKEKTNVGVASK